MKPSNLFNSDDRAVSPVIGVILMVAITVILAAVIGTFVLGLGDSLGDSQPTAQIDADISVVNNSTASLSIEHNGGDSIDTDALRVIVTDSADTTADNSSVFPSRFSVGDTSSADITTTGTGDEEVRIRIIHKPSDSVLVDRSVEVAGLGTIDGEQTLNFD